MPPETPLGEMWFTSPLVVTAACYTFSDCLWLMLLNPLSNMLLVSEGA